ncbi:protein DENND6A-like, partial [Xenia sp. Carnegie-2017]|uniref:protein DENND6A-like n=1 Tax=Xenia sp. Carnegie-2017 TaxID=2897299 RepID=UPI001F047C48
MASNLDDRACPRFLDGFHKNILPWDRFNRWITCFCVVTFDLELGQAMELIYPRFVRLSEKEKMSICYSAFPDSNSGCMGDTQFHFRMRSESGSCKSKSCCRSNENGLPFGYKSDFGHYYGFVYFRQVKDPSIPRGYFQKSIVLITRLPYVNFFSAVVKLVAPGYFNILELALEASCNDIDHWPYPVPGQTLSLPIMGSLIQVHLPSGKDKPGTILSPSSSLENTNAIPAPPIQISIPLLKETDMYRCISPVLNSIHLLWELVLLNEPIVVMAPSPSLCSDVVQTLITLIHPLHFNSDFRPFFTIHDSEFKEYTTKTHSPPPVIIGVTNPFFAKTLQHWPHILRIGAMNDLVIGGRNPLGNEKRSFEAKPGIYTRYKQYLQRDKLFIKAIKGYCV